MRNVIAYAEIKLFLFAGVWNAKQRIMKGDSGCI